MVALGRLVSSRVAVVVVGILLAAPAALAAPPAGDPNAVNKVTDLNRKALAAYGEQDFETAKNLLKDALQICADAGLDQHPITARTHLHFGAVAIVGFKQREAGIKQFKKALEIQPDIKLTKQIVTPELSDAFEEAQLASTGGNEGGAPGGEGEAGGEGAAGAAPSATDDEGGDETSHTRPKPRPRKPPKGEEDRDEGSDKGGFYLGLTIGSGAGFASGEGHLNPAHKLQSAGFAPAQLGQVEPQLGYFLSSSTLLSVALRLQYVSGTNGQYGCGANGSAYCNPVSLAAAGLLRATWLLGDGPFHWTLGAQVGAGYIAHPVKFTQTNCGTDGKTECVDAVLGGPFLIGPTAGLWYDLGSSVGLVAAVNTAIGAPKFTVNFDIDVGLGFRL
jgi:hypothetical protein